MSRQEAARRSRDDSRVKFAFGAWTALLLFAALALGSRLTNPKAAPVSGLLLCLGVTLAAAIGLTAQLAYHAGRCRDRSQSGDLPAFLMTMLPPFLPAVAFTGGHSTFVTVYLSGLFVGTFLAAWEITELGHFLRTVSERLKDLGGRGRNSVPPVELVERGGMLPFGEAENNGSAGHVANDMRAATVTLPTLEAIETEELSPLEARLLRADSAHVGPPEPMIAQWMTRTKLADGEERVEGSVRIEFAAKQKQAVAHIPFVPPFAHRPIVECHVIDGERVRVKIGTAQRYGARIEARRSDSADDALSVEVSFTAAAATARSDAA